MVDFHCLSALFLNQTYSFQTLLFSGNQSHHPLRCPWCLFPHPQGQSIYNSCSHFLWGVSPSSPLTCLSVTTVLGEAAAVSHPGPCSDSVASCLCASAVDWCKTWIRPHFCFVSQRLPSPRKTHLESITRAHEGLCGLAPACLPIPSSSLPSIPLLCWPFDCPSSTKFIPFSGLLLLPKLLFPFLYTSLALRLSFIASYSSLLQGDLSLATQREALVWPFCLLSPHFLYLLLSGFS